MKTLAYPAFIFRLHTRQENLNILHYLKFRNFNEISELRRSKKINRILLQIAYWTLSDKQVKSVAVHLKETQLKKWRLRNNLC